MAELPVIDCCTPLAGASLSEGRAAELETVIKALADRHRLRIVNLLLQADGEPVCVCEVQPLLGLAQGTVSHHLKLLVGAGIVARETRGTYSYFNLVPGALDSVREVFSTPGRVALHDQADPVQSTTAAGKQGAAAACC